MIGIYKITNNINNKIYIGQSIQVEKRLKRHKTIAFNPNDSCYNLPLYKAIRKYGIENFSFEIFEECKQQDLDNKEIALIKKLKTTDSNFGYNISNGGKSGQVHVILSQDEILEIIDVLKDTELSQTEIADYYCITQQMISEICLGNSWHQENEKYPLRNKNDKNFGENFSHVKIKQNVCIDCGKPIEYRAKKCVNCYNLFQRRVERPSRDELKNMIRNISFIQIGKKYNVSDNSIRKWCDSYKLPRRTIDIKKLSDKEWIDI